MTELKPKLWSDFDGTAVRTHHKADPRHWLKYPLGGMAGYQDFLESLVDSDVEVAGIVSRRRNNRLRRAATVRSIADLGLTGFFAPPRQIMLVDTETNKAGRIVDGSDIRTMALIDDKPHLVGHSLLSNLVELDKADDTTTKRDVVLGAVYHPETAGYVGRLLASARQVDYAQITSQGAGIHSLQGLSFTLNLVQLPPYSAVSGEWFAAVLQGVSSE